MYDYFRDFISMLSEIATILAFLWAVYEFYIKKRFKIKATASPSIVILKKEREYFFDFNIVNLSEQSLKRIDSIGIWIKRKNTFGCFWDVHLDSIGYQEKTKFTENIYYFLSSAIKKCIEEQTWIDKLFIPKLKIVLKTTIDREIEVKIDEYFKKEIDKEIKKIFLEYEKKIH